jgi:hypothetical protein
MGLRFFRVGGGGGSWKIAVVLLGAHTPSKIRRQFHEHKHTSLSLIRDDLQEFGFSPLR